MAFLHPPEIIFITRNPAVGRREPPFKSTIDHLQAQTATLAPWQAKRDT